MDSLKELRGFSIAHLDFFPAVSDPKRPIFTPTFIDGLAKARVAGMTAPRNSAGRGFFSQMAYSKIMEGRWRTVCLTASS